MLITTQLPRAFSLNEKGNEVQLADPNPTWSAEAVMNFYANTYPVLTNAKLSGPEIINDTVRYRFESMMGTKG